MFGFSIVNHSAIGVTPIENKSHLSWPRPGRAWAEESQRQIRSEKFSLEPVKALPVLVSLGGSVVSQNGGLIYNCTIMVNHGLTMVDIWLIYSLIYQ